MDSPKYSACPNTNHGGWWPEAKWRNAKHLVNWGNVDERPSRDGLFVSFPVTRHLTRNWNRCNLIFRTAQWGGSRGNYWPDWARRYINVLFAISFPSSSWVFPCLLSLYLLDISEHQLAIGSCESRSRRHDRRFHPCSPRFGSLAARCRRPRYPRASDT